MTDEELTLAMAELQEVVRCHCDEAYRDRGLKDPHCECDSAEAVKVVASRIKALTSERDELQLVVDKQGALLADAYGADLDWEEILKQRADHEAVKRIEALTKERDEAYRLFAFWRAEADRLTEHNGRACVRAETAEDRIEALEAKLAKAVEALEYYAVEASLWDRATSRQARAALAEIKGDTP